MKWVGAQDCLLDWHFPLSPKSVPHRRAGTAGTARSVYYRVAVRRIVDTFARPKSFSSLHTIQSATLAKGYRDLALVLLLEEALALQRHASPVIRSAAFTPLQSTF